MTTPTPAPLAHLPAAVSTVLNHQITIPAMWLTFLVATGLPAAVDLVTKRAAPSWWKSLVLAVLSALSGWLTSLNATGGSFDLRTFFSGTVLSFLTAHVAHIGLLQHLGLTGDNGLIQSLLPAGVGPGPSAAAHAASVVTSSGAAAPASGAGSGAGDAAAPAVAQATDDSPGG